MFTQMCRSFASWNSIVKAVSSNVGLGQRVKFLDFSHLYYIVNDTIMVSVTTVGAFVVANDIW